MRRVVFAAVLLLVCPIALASHFHHLTMSAPEDELRESPCTKEFAPAVLQPDVDKVMWAVTGNEQALPYFRQGITEYYGFNYEEAMRNFRMAKEKDPEMAMAAWGLALAAGPNINIGMDRGCRQLAVTESACAVNLAKKQKGISSVEVGLINALPLRYAAPLTETVAFSVAMRSVWLATKKQWEDAPSNPAAQKLKYAQNVANVGALYAESMLEMRPWGLFDAAYKPALDTPAIYEVLKTAMIAEPGAIGANHFWIHTAEASDAPEDAKHAADLLHTAVPGSGHLVHMPSHIELRLGDYAAAMKSNFDAVEIDSRQYDRPCAGSYETYSKNPLCPQLYYGHYQSHNLFFRNVAAAFRGQSLKAVISACATRAHVENFVVNEPGLQRYMTAPIMTLVMNRNWVAILAEKEPPPSDCYIQPPFKKPNGCHILRAMWYWAQGMAHAERGQLTLASGDYDAMALEMTEIAPPTPTGWGNNSAAAVLAIAQSMLQARYTWAGGQCKPCAQCKPGEGVACKLVGECDPSQCPAGLCDDAIAQGIEHLKLAVTHEDALVYDEPPQWFPPVREALGGAYLRAARLEGDRSEQIKKFKLAKTTFQEALCQNPKSGRALYGLTRSLEGLEGQPAEVTNKFCKSWKDADYTMTAEQARSQFCEVWKDADYTMTDGDLWPAIHGGSDAGSGITCPSGETKVKAPSQASCVP